MYKGNRITGSVLVGGGDINVYILDAANLAKYTSGSSFTSYYREQRVSHLPSVDFTVPFDGTWAVLLDNQYSIWTSKSVAIQLTVDNSGSSDSSSPCIIATATCGSPLASEVVFMRSVRDNMIGSSPTGKAIVYGWNAFYYSWSPPVAQSVSGSDGLKDTFKILLAPLLGEMHVVAATYNNWLWLNPDFAAVAAFSVAATLAICTYIVLPVIAAIFVLKYFKKNLLKRKLSIHAS